MSAPLWTFDEIVDGDRGAGRSASRPDADHRHLHRQPHDQAGRGLLRHPRRHASTATTSRRGAGRGCGDGGGLRGAAVVARQGQRLAGRRRRRARGARARSAAPRARGARRRSPRSPAASARPAPRRCSAAALAPDGEVHYSPASFNNHWGVPLTLARMPASARFGIFEIGMNHAGEIEPLTRMVRPHVAIVTTVEPVHLEFFDSVEEIARGQGGDLPRPRAGRRRHHQPRQSALPTS